MPTINGLRPPCVVSHVRTRLESMATEVNRDSRPWYVRWFISPVDTDSPYAAEVIQLSHCDVQSRTCTGDMVSIWLVSQTIVVRYENDAPALSSADESSVQAMVELPVFIFGLSDDNNAVVVWEIGISGIRTRSAFALPRGLASDTFGERIGETTQDVIAKESPWHPLIRFNAAAKRANAQGMVGT